VVRQILGCTTFALPYGSYLRDEALRLCLCPTVLSVSTRDYGNISQRGDGVFGFDRGSRCVFVDTGMGGLISDGVLLWMAGMTGLTWYLDSIETRVYEARARCSPSMVYRGDTHV